MEDLIKQIEMGNSVVINNVTFDKQLLDELSVDLRGAYHIYKDVECQKFIHAYLDYKNNNKKSDNDDNYSHNFLIAFIIGFAGGVFIAGCIAVIEQLIIK